MIEKRIVICERCDGRGCRQVVAPLSQEEYEYIGAKPDDIPTLETFTKLMEISLKPECREHMLAEHPLEWWFSRLPR